MIAYHIAFAISCAVILYNIRACLRYLRAIDYTVGVSLNTAVAKALKDNSHHKKSLRKAIDEHKRLMPMWFVSQVAFITVVVVWYASSDTGMLSDVSAFVAAAAVTTAIARPFTAPIDWKWLIMWNSGVQAVGIICHRESIVARIAEIMACDDAASDPLAYIELETLYSELGRIDGLIGIALGSPKSENGELPQAPSLD